METLSISITPDILEFLQKEALRCGFENTSEYVEELIRSDIRRKESEVLEERLLEGLNSGDAKEMTFTDWDEIKQRVIQQANRK